MGKQELKVERIETGFEVYRIHNGCDHGTALLRAWRNGDNYCGEVLFHTSFGSYGHAWGHMGVPLKEFLARAGRKGSMDYIMGKLAGEAMREYDHDGTVVNCKKEIIRMRRDRDLTKDEAREDWDTIEDADSNPVRMYDAMSETKAFESDCGGMSAERPNPQCVGFWEDIFLPLCGLLEQELQAEQQKAA